MKINKSIETSHLVIKGNLLTWEGTMLQLSNVSCVSASNLLEEKPPLIPIVTFIIGLLCLTKQPIVAILVLAFSAGWIYLWYRKNEVRKQKAFLNITMNSGDRLSFLFDNKGFLFEVLDLLEAIITEGGVGNQDISIDLHDSHLSGNASLFIDSNIGERTS